MRVPLRVQKKLAHLAPLDGLRRGIWRHRPTPEACEGVPTMLMEDELRLLEYLAEVYYRRRGAIVDAGSFLGGSTLALASGLRKHLARRWRRERRLIHAFDRFEIEDWTRGIYFPETARSGEGTRARFDRNVADYAPLIEVHEGDIAGTKWIGGKIEILFIDVAKSPSVSDWITENLFPHLIPGRSIVVQQDYLYPHTTAWLHVTMEYYAGEFDYVCDTGDNSVAFRLVRPFAPGRLRPRLVETMPRDEKAALMDRAAARFSGRQADVIRASRDHYLGMLDESAQAARAGATSAIGAGARAGSAGSDRHCT